MLPVDRGETLLARRGQVIATARRFRVLVVDDHQLVRAGFRTLVERMPDAEVVGEAADGREAIRLVHELKPQLVLMDISMQGLNGLSATERIMRDLPETRILILSVHSDEEYVANALRAGASGYILKGGSVAELELAIRAVARGEVFLTPVVSKQVVAEYVKRLMPGGGGGTPLTPRQREVLQLIAEGSSTKQIATQLKLSIKTVESHRTQLMRRLGLHDVAGLVRYAIREGVVSSDR